MYSGQTGEEFEAQIFIGMLILEYLKQQYFKCQHFTGFKCTAGPITTSPPMLYPSGVVYYQRLRHMVSDKYQVRTTGPIDQLTHQPIKGRKRAGGVR